MQNIIVEKPYRFVPPYPGEFWTRLFRYYLRRYLRQTWAIASAEIRGIELLQESIRKGFGILLAPNHCRPGDPLVMGLLNEESGRPIHTMASWHLFTESRFKAWLLRRIGGFSIFREGLDREALRAAIRILVEAKRPLVIFPEGRITRTNDRLSTLQEGVAFLARTAAKQRAQATPPGQVVVHPVALKYYFEGDLAASVSPVLEAIETRLSWRPQRQRPLLERIYRVGEALLSLKEIEYLGRAQPGLLHERLSALIDHLLGPLEKEWLNGQREPSVIERVKRLRAAIVPDLVAGEIAEDERARRWQHLGDIYLAQQLDCYPEHYISERPTPERLLETVERFEEDLTDVARCHGPLRVVIELGPALEVRPTREKGGSEDPLTITLARQLQEMLQRLAHEPRRRPQPESTWQSFLLWFAVAFAGALATGPVLGQELSTPLLDPAIHSPLAPVLGGEGLVRPPLAPVLGGEGLGVRERGALRATVLTAPSLRPPWEIRILLVIVALTVWHMTQRSLGGRRPASAAEAEQAGQFLSEHDVLLRLTWPVNRFLNAHRSWANALLAVSSALIDGLGLFLFTWSIVGPSIRPFLGLCILFGLRQFCQALTALPPPVGSIWRSPGFPSLFVTYGVSNDLFFSGHTALAVYGAVELAGLGTGWLIGVAIAIAVFEMVAVLLLRAHYTMDVFAGLMTALYVAGIAACLALPCDRALAQALGGTS